MARRGGLRAAKRVRAAKEKRQSVARTRASLDHRSINICQRLSGRIYDRRSSSSSLMDFWASAPRTTPPHYTHATPPRALVGFYLCPRYTHTATTCTRTFYPIGVVGQAWGLHMHTHTTRRTTPPLPHLYTPCHHHPTTRICPHCHHTP